MSEANKNPNFDELVVEYQDKIYNLCYRFMGNHHDANDCAQDTFVKAFKSLKTFRGDAAISTWLYRIAVNTCKNKLSSLAYRFRKLTVAPVEIKDDSQSPEVQFEKDEKGRLIQKAIDSLPNDHKTVVVLRDVEELSYEEIAKVTGYNIGTVKSKLARARGRLREKLEGQV